ncbi:MAG: hypothetical protein HC887_00850 [Desulfobacteraceae bacterium]|nr:hypothetical protein [Desulfobacteraceae bacterium]
MNLWIWLVISLILILFVLICIVLSVSELREKTLLLPPETPEPFQMGNTRDPARSDYSAFRLKKTLPKPING